MKTKIHFVLAIVAMVFTFTLKSQCCTPNAGTNKVICCAGGWVTLGGSPSGTESCAGCDSISYFWQPATGLNNVNYPNPTASPMSTTIYTLCITAYRGDSCRKVCCIGCKTVQVTVNTSCCRIGTSSALPSKVRGEVAIYPNPAKTDLNVEIKTKVVNAQLVITDITGKVVYKKDDIKDAVKTNVDTSTLPKGMYLIKLNDLGEDIYNDKFIIE